MLHHQINQLDIDKLNELSSIELEARLTDVMHRITHLEHMLAEATELAVEISKRVSDHKLREIHKEVAGEPEWEPPVEPSFGMVPPAPEVTQFPLWWAIYPAIWSWWAGRVPENYRAVRGRSTWENGLKTMQYSNRPLRVVWAEDTCNLSSMEWTEWEADREEVMKTITNVPFDKLEVGQSTYQVRVADDSAIQLGALYSGDHNPVHLDPVYASKTRFGGRIVHGLWIEGAISAILGMELPGTGTILVSKEVHYRAPVHIGDEITIILTCTSKREDRPRAMFSITAQNHLGETVLFGTCDVLCPTKKEECAHILPSVQMK